MKHRDGTYLVLGIAGRAGAGKDTCADVLCENYQFFRMAFADPVRAEITDAFGIDPGLFLLPSKEVKTDALAIGRCNDSAFIALMAKVGENISAPRSPREIMRWWGTEYRRRQNPAYWLERAAETINDATRRGFRRIAITDVRFQNEADFVRLYNGEIWLITRTETDLITANHQSEREISSIHPDTIISNNKSMSRYAFEIMKAYEGRHCESHHETPQTV